MMSQAKRPRVRRAATIAGLVFLTGCNATWSGWVAVTASPDPSCRVTNLAVAGQPSVAGDYESRNRWRVFHEIGTGEPGERSSSDYTLLRAGPGFCDIGYVIGVQNHRLDVSIVALDLQSPPDGFAHLTGMLGSAAGMFGVVKQGEQR